MMRAAVRYLAVLVCLAAPGASFAQSPLTIRLYDAAGRSAAERADAIATAASIFADAGLRITWLDCGRHGADYPCAASRQPQDLVVRIVARAVASEPTSANAVTAGDDAETEREAAAEPTLRLGAAAVTRTDRAGVVATVYAEHVGSVTKRTGVQFALLLGRAIAHEVGHLFPGGDNHSPTGLMRAVWTDGELRRNQPPDWVFVPAVTTSPTTR
jgi:hypothetical protein